MLNTQSQIIIAIIILVIITIFIWTLAFKSYQKGNGLNLRLSILMNIILPVIILGILKLLSPKTYLVNENYNVVEYVNLIGSTIDMANGNKIIISPFESTLLNNTDRSLIIEKVTYSLSPIYTTNNEAKVIVNPYTKQKTNHIDYFFETPPNSISVKHGNKTEKIWLHY